jgi:flagellar motor switch protein FliM
MAILATMPMKEVRDPDVAVGNAPMASGSNSAPGPTAVQGTITLSEQPSGPQDRMATIERHPEWTLLSRIPMRLTASVPMPKFRVSDLLNLRPGSLVLSNWPSGDDVELKIGAVQLSWSEFEVVEQRIAIRLTRLA